MIKLHANLASRWNAEPFVSRVTTNRALPAPLRDRHVLLADGGLDRSGIEGFAATFVRAASREAQHADAGWIALPEDVSYLSDGDVVRVNPVAGALWVMYRRASGHNFLFLTERCNSNCVMCSQPPRLVDDGHLLDAWLQAVPLMSPDTPELGITGGEPTLLGDGLIELLRTCRDNLPRAALHMLSNGRLFNYLSLCRAVAAVDHPDLMVGVPLYSDLPDRHDFVVQAAGAFDQTVRGLMNLSRCGVRIEIRVVLHAQTVGRLPQLARFITRNLPFVEHVALMGLEMMGYVKMNLDALWVDPLDYQQQLAEAVEELDRNRVAVSIYNHQLCVLDRALWPLARRSISDWKNEYVGPCSDCAARSECGGFFASARLRCSRGIRPIAANAVATGT
jgi:His-Xaa-Ser system radical SAM maturase HxsC